MMIPKVKIESLGGGYVRVTTSYYTKFDTLGFHDSTLIQTVVHDGEGELSTLKEIAHTVRAQINGFERYLEK